MNKQIRRLKMDFMECLPFILILVGAGLTYASLNNDQVTISSWAAGRTYRYKDDSEYGKNEKKGNLIVRIIGMIMFLSGFAIIIIPKK
jgi:hypothetical protein